MVDDLDSSCPPVGRWLANVNSEFLHYVQHGGGWSCRSAEDGVEAQGSRDPRTRVCGGSMCTDVREGGHTLKIADIPRGAVGLRRRSGTWDPVQLPPCRGEGPPQDVGRQCSGSRCPVKSV